jgi:DNA-binding response OmpR family regulator
MTVANWGKGRKIVVIDDDPRALETATQLLEQAGFRVASYGGTCNRLAYIARERPDAVLLDVNMPLVPGDELCRLMRDHVELRSIPVLFFSSNDEDTLRSLVRECGAAGYVPKAEMAFGFGAKVARRLDSSGHGTS